MFQLLPPPPRFILPPPPMLPADLLDAKLLLQLTCSSIRGGREERRTQYMHVYFILTCCLVLLITIIVFILLSMWSRLSREAKTPVNPRISSDSSICNNRSYETISSGIYLESINTTAADTTESMYDQISSPPHCDLRSC